jgi:hypothetical protein
MMKKRSGKAGKWICLPCGGKTFATKSDLSQHIETKHVNSEMICPLCVKVVKTRLEFGKHMKRVHRGVILDWTPLPELDPTPLSSMYRPPPPPANEAITEAAFESDDNK